MNTRTAAILARKKMKEHGLLARGWTFQYDNAVRRAGCCHWRTKTITLSKSITRLNTESEVLNTILHEIAHELAGPHAGHNWLWKEKCIEIGARPERCYTRAQKKTPVPKYIAVCPAGHKTQGHRRNKVSCSRCLPYFSREHMFVWSLNPEYK